MCIILFKAPSLPIEYSLLASSFLANPDGAGLMFPQGGKVRVVKGFMDFASLESFLQDNESWLVGLPINFHFRLRTHGATNQANCHPYPITRDHRQLGLVDGLVKVALMHNGIIPSTLAPNDPSLSDTAIFIRNHVARRRGKRKQLAALRHTPDWNKFALMDGTGHTTFIGRFDSPISAHSYFVSNTSYLSKLWVGGSKRMPTYHEVAHREVFPSSNSIWGDCEEEAWWREQGVKERSQVERDEEFMVEAGWKVASTPALMVPPEEPECERCGEAATCWVFQMPLCVECMKEVVMGEGEDRKGVLTCPES